MDTVLSFLTAQLWKIATGLAALLAVVLLIMLLATKGDLKKMTADRDAQHDAIYAEKTGWAARLNQCETNGAQLDQALRDQNEQVRLAGVASAKKTAAAEAALKGAQAANQTAQTKVANLMQRLVSIDSCARVNEIDSRFLDSLK